MAAQSRLREVARQLALELRKVMGDHGDSQNAAESTPWVRDQAGIGTPPRCNVPACVCLPSVAHKCLSPSSHDGESPRLGTHDHLEFEWIAFAGSLDLDHPAPFRHVRTGPRQFDISYSPPRLAGSNAIDQIEI